MECIQYSGKNYCRREPTWKTRRRWKAHINVNFIEIGRESVHRIHIVQDRMQCWAFVDMGMELRIP